MERIRREVAEGMQKNGLGHFVLAADKKKVSPVLGQNVGACLAHLPRRSIGPWSFGMKKIALFLGLAGVAGLSQAALPTAVETSLNGIGTDAAAAAVIMLGVVASLLVFKYIRRQMH